MGGRIEVVSEHGKGSTFRFFVRVRTCQTQKRHATSDVDMSETEVGARPAAKRRQMTATSKPTKPSVIGPRPHVLIVEDNLINQTVLARQLKHVGLTCEGKWIISIVISWRRSGRGGRMEKIIVTQRGADGFSC